MKKKSKVTKVIKGIVIAILLVVLAFNVSILFQAKTKPNKVPSIFGYKPFIVVSGSMEKFIHVGDLVIVKEIDPNTLKENDIIAFRDSENLVTTHRIISVTKVDGQSCFETKGDNNNTKDEGMVCAPNVEGKYVSKISKIGNFILFIQQPLGFVIMMMSIFIVCMIIYWISNKKSGKQISDEDLKAFEEFKKSRQKDGK